MNNPFCDRRIELMVLDVDGVLTDGAVYCDRAGEAMLRFSRRDGHGIARVLARGLGLAVISRESSPIALARLTKLGIDDVHLGVRDKRARLLEVCEARGVDAARCVFVGDDEPDVPAMAAVALAIAPADAMPCAREAAHFVTEAPGGNGSVREVCELWIEAQPSGEAKGGGRETA